AQIKKGLTQGNGLWDAMEDLAEALHFGVAAYGVLVVSPSSSKPVREELADGVVQIGEGKTPQTGTPAATLADRLAARGWDAQALCARLRIVTVAATNFSDGDLRAALAHMAALLVKP